MIQTVIPAKYEVMSGTTVQVVVNTTNVGPLTLLMDTDNTLVTCPSSATVLAAATSVTFNMVVGVMTVGDVFNLRVRYQDQIVTTTFRVIGTSIASMSLSDMVLNGPGDTTVLTVTLAAAAPTTGLFVNIDQTMNAAVAFEGLPGAMYIASGASSGITTLTSQAVTRPVLVQLSASLGDSGIVQATTVALINP